MLRQRIRQKLEKNRGNEVGFKNDDQAAREVFKLGPEKRVIDYGWVLTRVGTWDSRISCIS